MDILHRCMFHLIYLTAIFAEILRCENFDLESTAIIGGLASISGVVAIEYFFAKNRDSFKSFMKTPTWKTAKKILLLNKKNEGT